MTDKETNMVRQQLPDVPRDDALMITFVSPKGGTGKSTTLLALMGAIHAAEPSARVRVMDMDSQNTVTNILDTRRDYGLDCSWFDVYAYDGEKSLNSAAVLKLAQSLSAGYDYILVDTKGSAAREAIYLASISDLAIITAKYNVSELGPGARFYEEMTAALKETTVEPNMVFLETRRDTFEDRESKDVRRQFNALGYPKLETVISAQKAFENMARTAKFVGELAAEQPDRSGYQSAVRVTDALWNEIRSHLKGSRND